MMKERKRREIPKMEEQRIDDPLLIMEKKGDGLNK
jgi:hypothetical protein